MTAPSPCVREGFRSRWRAATTATMLRSGAALVSLAVVLSACAREPLRSAGPGARTQGSAARPPTAPPEAPHAGGPLRQASARAYGLALINRDRAAAGLGPVAADDVASAAALRHVRDLVAHGVTAHWGTDGSVPEQRYTEAGGEDLATENVACYADARARQVNDVGPFAPGGIDRFQAAFMAETPPADGHRKNILGPLHTKVGLAYATTPGSDIVCVVQEFVDDYGSYAPLPREAKQGGVLRVSGEIKAPASFGGIGLARVPLPLPRSGEELLTTGGYTMPDPAVAYFPKGYKTPKPVELDGPRFALDLPLTGVSGPGLYEIQIFVKLPGGEAGKLVPVSLRTVRVP